MSGFDPDPPSSNGLTPLLAENFSRGGSNRDVRRCVKAGIQPPTCTSVHGRSSTHVGTAKPHSNPKTFRAGSTESMANDRR
jgi:hypothetical protein